MIDDRSSILTRHSLIASATYAMDCSAGVDRRCVLAVDHRYVGHSHPGGNGFLGAQCRAAGHQKDGSRHATDYPFGPDDADGCVSIRSHVTPGKK